MDPIIDDEKNTESNKVQIVSPVKQIEDQAKSEIGRRIDTGVPYKRKRRVRRNSPLTKRQRGKKKAILKRKISGKAPSRKNNKKKKTTHRLKKDIFS